MSVKAKANPRQLPLDLGHHAEFSRDSLVVSPANAKAVAAIDRWPDWPSPVVILAGPTGSGKTHLGAVWAEAADAQRIPLEGLGLACQVAEAGRPVLIDGVEARGFDQTALFHLINSVRAANSFLLMTSRTFPLAWGVSLPDLESRLKAATVVEIGEPDDMLLAGVITKLFADRQLDVEAHVVSYLVSRMERSLSTAGRVVEKLDRAALEQKSRITRGLAAQVVTAMDQGQGEFEL
ncbi:DnaA regulatory inactivator HdaA [Aquibium sp. LZ166]|uniref:DnaA regulatory inactivator HdaA n=1 Tax=Aquibium pacificus TaxID=3153579 RepID=A0ABV3SQ72_9HYPH